MRVFLDSSALAKRYIREPGTEEVNELCRNASEILVSVISVPEIHSALNRTVRLGKLSKTQYRQLKHSFLNDVSEATIIALSEEIITKAILCLEKTPLKTLDALHVASALHFGCELFVTADKAQGRAATALGLKRKMIC